MTKDIKNYLKFLLKKEYRFYIKRLEEEGRIEKINDKEFLSDKKVMILIRDNKNVGTFSDYIVFLRMIEQAVEKNYIPIIDRKSVKNIFFPAADNINTWEVFFEQPLNISLEKVNLTDMEVFVKHISSRTEPVSLMHCSDDNVVNYWRNIAKKYIRFNAETKMYLESEKRKLLDGKRILGVSVREGYMKLSTNEPERINNHPRQVEIPELIGYVEKYMYEWNCQYIFFTCQTIETEKIFKERFRDKAICVERKREMYKELLEGSALETKPREDAFKKELEYVTEIYLLSNCTSFLCSENSGSEAAFIMSNGFENFKCIKKGIY